VAADALGGSATVTLTPLTNLPHTLYVRSMDRAGNLSPVTAYSFNVGTGAGTVLSPHTADTSAAKFALVAQGQTGATGVTYQWRRGDADAWTTIPAADVTYAAGGGAVTWPQPTTGSGAFAKLNWDTASTLNNAEAGTDPLSGPLQVRATFVGAGGDSDPVKITFDLNRGWATSVGVGPGSVNLVTGSLGVGQADVSVFGMGVSRTFNTRQASDVDAMFGPGWISSAATEANSGYTDLTVTGSLVQIGLANGATLGFTQHDSLDTTFDPQVGSETYTLTRDASTGVFTLIDQAGNTVVFTQPTGAAAGVFSPSSSTPTGSSTTSTVAWELVPGSTTQARPTRILAPVPSGVSCPPALNQGCRALTFTYATATTATGTSEAQWGDYLNRLVKVEFSGYDPDLSAMQTVEIAHYAYDSTGRLRAVWDPRLNWTDTGVTPPVTRHLQTTYAYDGNGILTTLTPPGQEPWQFGYTTVPADSGLGRLATVTRSALSAGTAVSTVVYRVPVSGTGAPYDMSASQTARWGQADAPTDAAAVYPPTQIPDGNQAAGTLPSSYEQATVTYLDASGRMVDIASPGGGIEATWYDLFGNETQTLTAGNRKRALDASGSDAEAAEAIQAANLSTVNTYSSDGQQLLSTMGPEHDVALSSGALVRGRSRTAYVYDEGSPAGGPYNLVTTTTSGVRYIGAAGTPVDADVRTSTTDYDWNLRLPVVETIDPAGLALTTRTAYDTAGRVTSITAPEGGVTTNTPSTRKTTYYTAAANGTYPSCGGKSHWEGLVCRTDPGGQPGSGAEMPYTVYTYDLYGQVRTAIEYNSGGALRTTTLTYANGRPDTVSISSALGTAVPTTKTIYEQTTGLAVKTQSLDGGGGVTAQIVRGYDTLGRLTSYTDADGNAATTTYDLASRVATTFDGKATRTYTYDGGTERRGLPTQVVDTGAGTFTASYDTDGTPVSQTWPNGITVAIGANEETTPISITYAQPGCGQADCTLFAETVAVGASGQWRGRSSSFSAQSFSYDPAGRLTTVNDTVSGQCVTRVYAFSGTSGKASNRTGLTSYDPNTDGSCQTTTPSSSRSYTYDSADRITTSGTVYDNLGRTLTTPASDSNLPANGNVTMTYHTNDMVRSIGQNGRTGTYTLDVIANRFRSWTDNGTGTLLTKTNHYTNDEDNPAWTNEGDSTWTRPVAGLAGLAAIQVGPSAGSVVIQLVNLHGDITAGAAAGSLGLAYTYESTEYGMSRDPAATGTRRYGWLGRYQRTADTPSGIYLMGARQYNSALGRFQSVDPVSGGSANAYEYCFADPAKCTDVTGTHAESQGGCGRLPRVKWTWWGRKLLFNKCQTAKIANLTNYGSVDFSTIVVVAIVAAISGAAGVAASVIVAEMYWIIKEANNARNAHGCLQVNKYYGSGAFVWPSTYHHGCV
jgi:RHS repeat-associated protein